MALLQQVSGCFIILWWVYLHWTCMSPQPAICTHLLCYRDDLWQDNGSTTIRGMNPLGHSSHKAAGEKTSSDTVSHWNLERLSKKTNNMMTLTYKCPRHSQITARALRPGRGIFITFMSYIHWHSNITYLWWVLTSFLSLPEESYVEMWTGRSS